MRFNDPAGIADFLLQHRLAHVEINNKIAAKTGQTLGAPGLDATTVQAAWGRAMAGGAEQELLPGDAQVLADWLTWHDGLHQAEYFAIGYGTAPDMSQLDFRREDAFYSWMFVHAQVHDVMASALGLS
jgi:hypothetical protein